MNATLPEIHLTKPEEQQTKIVRARVPSVAIIEITKDELDILEQGTPSGLYLNFAIFSWSIAAGFFASLMTSTIDSLKTFTVFVVIVTVGVISGLVLTVVWWKSQCPVKECLKKIKNRIPTDP